MKAGYILVTAHKLRASNYIMLLFTFLFLFLVSCDSTPKETFKLTIEASEGGTIPAGQEDEINGNYEEGADISIIARPNPGYSFVNWTTSSGGTLKDANNSQTIFTMPSSDTTVTAHFVALDKND